jgi:hypothetical protein
MTIAKCLLKMPKELGKRIAELPCEPCDALPRITVAINGYDSSEERGDKSHFVRRYSIKLMGLSDEQARQIKKDLGVEEMDVQPLGHLYLTTLVGRERDVDHWVAVAGHQLEEKGYPFLPQQAIYDAIMADCAKYQEKYGQSVETTKKTKNRHSVAASII